MLEEPIHLPSPIIFYFSKFCLSGKLENTQSEDKEFNDELFNKGFGSFSKKSLDPNPVFAFYGLSRSNGFQRKHLDEKGFDNNYS